MPCGEGWWIPSMAACGAIWSVPLEEYQEGVDTFHRFVSFKVGDDSSVRF